jgi:membrane-bound serine protease (ClpP class)
MQAVKQMCPILIVLIALLPFTPRLRAQDNDKNTQQIGTIIQLDIEGAIGPATSDYIDRSLDKAAMSNAILVLIRIDTPGGLDTSMRQIIKKIIASPIPVVSYVAPGGARAASAGTYILYASHIAAMAPATNIGAATPIQIFSPDASDKDKQHDKSTDDQTRPVAPDNPMAKKAINDAVAYIRGLAKMRGRNAEWAEKSVREAASIPAQEALEHNVIDLIAANQTELLSKLNGLNINVLGRSITLHTEKAIVKHLAPDWRSELLSVITDPNIAYFLMLVGIYGLILEFYNPGAIVPGTIGGISLLLALYAFQMLPVNYAGIALIFLGIALMIGEAFAPGIGILGLGGVVAFVIGSVILIDTDAPDYGINIGLIAGLALSSAAFFILALGIMIKARRNPIVSGREELIGETGIALEDFEETGMVRMHSENWRAITNQALHKNDKVKVKNLDGLTLIVTPYRTGE